MIADEQANQTVQQMTPQLLDIFEKVMGPPEAQLEPETREVLRKTVRALYEAQHDLLASRPGLLQLAGVR